eukprot:5323344-Prymnesium_polylepis.2
MIVSGATRGRRSRTRSSDQNTSETGNADTRTRSTQHSHRDKRSGNGGQATLHDPRRKGQGERSRHVHT